MSEASSIHTSWTVKPWMSMPRMRVGVLLGLGAVLGELDAAGLAAAADQHLRLDDARVADLLGGRDGLVDGRRGRAVRDRDPVAGEELLSLIFEKVHCCGRI